MTTSKLLNFAIGLTFIILVSAPRLAWSEESCACDSMDISCISAEQMQELCPGAQACAGNKSVSRSPCNMFVKNEDCSRLGLDFLTGPVAANRYDGVDCAGGIVANSQDPLRDLSTAKSCCVVKHEIGHIKDPVCIDPLGPRMCNEIHTYGISSQCTSDTTNAFCGLYKRVERYKEFCRDLCSETLYWHAHSLYAACECRNRTQGTTVDCRANCHENLSPDDIPIECQGGSTDDGTALSEGLALVCDVVGEKHYDIILDDGAPPAPPNPDEEPMPVPSSEGTASSSWTPER